ncbi:hypothetical protein O3P69_003578 [Scylla paramamosain]|uniref:Uncharacterized protein n=1 Tax=Scylla paramamosain TaxID=85552 RepID=A0AAW0UN48_SCYPA
MHYHVCKVFRGNESKNLWGVYCDEAQVFQRCHPSFCLKHHLTGTCSYEFPRTAVYKRGRGDTVSQLAPATVHRAVTTSSSGAQFLRERKVQCSCSQVSQSQGARKCVKKMNPGDSKTVKIPCNGQTKGCKPFCKKECDGYIFMCDGGHLEADMQNVNLDCNLEKIVVNDGSGPVSMCDPMDDITAGEKLTIRYKKLGDASFFDDGSCTSGKCSLVSTLKPPNRSVGWRLHRGGVRRGGAGQGKARQGKARQGKGKTKQGKTKQGKARQGRQGRARQARQGKARQGRARQNKAGQGKTRQGKAGKAGQGKTRQGKARQGRARQGRGKGKAEAGQGKGRAEARQGQGRARARAEAGQGQGQRQGQGQGRGRGKGKAGQGKGKARQGKARQGKARQGKARQDKAGQGRARQDKAGQGKQGEGMNY